MPNYNLKEIETRCFMGGDFVDTEGGSLDKISPIDGQPLPSLHACSVSDIDKAVNIAKDAFSLGLWRNTPAYQKKECLLRLASLIDQDRAYLAFLDTIETGRAYNNFLKDSIPKAVKALRWFAECVDKIEGSYFSPAGDKMCLVGHEPLGVVAAIVPWNDPLVVAIWKLGPAILMGNSLLIKPAEEASYSLLRLAKLSKDAGIPSGVLNIVPGFGEIAGQALASHSQVRGIYFTGSTVVGKLIMSAAALSNMKKVGLECGGKSAFIVSQKCGDLKLAAATLAKNMFYNQGQICSAPSRLLLDKKIEKFFLETLLGEIKAYIPRDPWAPDSLVGSICSQKQYKSIQGYIHRAELAGIKKITSDLIEAPYKNGFYLAPTIFIDVPTDAEIAQHEIFGPVLVVHSFDQMDEAIRIANNTPYGLAAAIWSDDLNESLLCSKALEAGIVHINSYGDDDEATPFGGIKESGIGKDKSMLVFEEYVNKKATWLQLKNIA